VTDYQEQDGYVHPAMLWQAQHEGRISISLDDHRAMIAALATQDWQWSQKVFNATWPGSREMEARGTLKLEPILSVKFRVL
jgi:hypothetical protein